MQHVGRDQHIRWCFAQLEATRPRGGAVVSARASTDPAEALRNRLRAARADPARAPSAGTNRGRALPGRRRHVPARAACRRASCRWRSVSRERRARLPRHGRARAPDARTAPGCRAQRGEARAKRRRRAAVRGVGTAPAAPRDGATLRGGQAARRATRADRRSTARRQTTFRGGAGPTLPRTNQQAFAEQPVRARERNNERRGNAATRRRSRGRRHCIHVRHAVPDSGRRRRSRWGRGRPAGLLDCAWGRSRSIPAWAVEIPSAIYNSSARRERTRECCGLVTETSACASDTHRCAGMMTQRHSDPILHPRRDAGLSHTRNGLGESGARGRGRWQRVTAVYHPTSARAHASWTTTSPHSPAFPFPTPTRRAFGGRPPATGQRSVSTRPRPGLRRPSLIPVFP